MTAKQPYECYKLPKSSEKGQPFVDFNEVLNKVLKREHQLATEMKNKNRNKRRIRKVRKKDE